MSAVASFNTRVGEDGAEERAKNYVYSFDELMQGYNLTFSFLKEFGKLYLPPTGKGKGKHNQACYSNSALKASAEGLIYVEGYAMPKGLIPISHAWCVDDEGKVYDPTWDVGYGVSYFGVPFDPDFVNETAALTGYWGGIFESLYLLREKEPLYEYLKSGVVCE